jgi:hypothetical protein
MGKPWAPSLLSSAPKASLSSKNSQNLFDISHCFQSNIFLVAQRHSLPSCKIRQKFEKEGDVKKSLGILPFLPFFAKIARSSV